MTTPKNEKQITIYGEAEFIFLNQRDTAFGELTASSFFETSIISSVKTFTSQVLDVGEYPASSQALVISPLFTKRQLRNFCCPSVNIFFFSGSKFI